MRFEDHGEVGLRVLNPALNSDVFCLLDVFENLQAVRVGMAVRLSDSPRPDDQGAHECIQSVVVSLELRTASLDFCR